jgi:hypothetical protein
VHDSLFITRPSNLEARLPHSLPLLHYTTGQLSKRFRAPLLYARHYDSLHDPMLPYSLGNFSIHCSLRALLFRRHLRHSLLHYNTLPYITLRSRRIFIIVAYS